MKTKSHTPSLLSTRIFVVFAIFSLASSCRFIDDLENILKDQKDENKKVFTAKLDALNHSGVKGHATLTLQGNKLTVKIHAEGLEADATHPQHIHGLENGENATCPPASADKNGNGLVEIGEGLPFYGPVLLPLEPFTMAPDSMIDYKHTFTLGEEDVVSYQDLKPLENRVIVLHGMTVNGEYMASLPVACGEIKAKGEEDQEDQGDQGEDY